MGFTLSISKCTIKQPKAVDNFRIPKGRLALPGVYYVGLSKEENGVITKLSDKVSFEVIKMRNGALSTDNMDNISAFWEKASSMQGKISAINLALINLDSKIIALDKSLDSSSTLPGEFDKELYNIRAKLLALNMRLRGPKAQRQVGEKPLTPSVNNRFMTVIMGISNSTYGPTHTHRQTLSIVESELTEIQEQLLQLRNNDIPAFEKAILKEGAPWVEGMSVVY